MAIPLTPQEAALAATGENPETAARSAPPLQPSDDLERVLPEIKDLALKVGGLDRLAELVTTLREMKS